jgi:hypothetical protein
MQESLRYLAPFMSRLSSWCRRVATGRAGPASAWPPARTSPAGAAAAFPLTRMTWPQGSFRATPVPRAGSGSVRLDRRLILEAAMPLTAVAASARGQDPGVFGLAGAVWPLPRWSRGGRLVRCAAISFSVAAEGLWCIAGWPGRAALDETQDAVPGRMEAGVEPEGPGRASHHQTVARHRVPSQAETAGERIGHTIALIGA